MVFKFLSGSDDFMVLPLLIFGGIGYETDINGFEKKLTQIQFLHENCM